MICAIALAAGRSRRMGAQKLLLPLRGRPVIAHVVDELLASPVHEVFVVIGPDGARLREALADRPVHVVVNPNTGDEMLGSVRRGLAALPEDCRAVVVALGDQPGVTRRVIGALIGAFEATGRGIVVPTHEGRRGHPLLFAAHYRDEVLSRYDGVGLRGLLRAHPDDIHEAPVGEHDILDDLDEPEDYVRARSRFRETRGGDGSAASTGGGEDV
jgi:molybdenum cofactor cytidylyltransferase